MKKKKLYKIISVEFRDWKETWLGVNGEVEYEFSRPMVFALLECGHIQTRTPRRYFNRGKSKPLQAIRCERMEHEEEAKRRRRNENVSYVTETEIHQVVRKKRPS